MVTISDDTSFDEPKKHFGRGVMPPPSPVVASHSGEQPIVIISDESEQMSVDSTAPSRMSVNLSSLDTEATPVPSQSHADLVSFNADFGLQGPSLKVSSDDDIHIAPSSETGAPQSRFGFPPKQPSELSMGDVTSDSQDEYSHLRKLKFGAELQQIFQELQEDFEKDLRKQLKKIGKLQRKYINKIDDVLCFVLDEQIQKQKGEKVIEQ